MVTETFAQAGIFSGFILPFFLIFIIAFAILEKTKILGGNKQINAIVSLVIGFIFIGATEPKLLVANLILFLSVGLIILFVGMLLWGFINGEGEKPFEIASSMRITIGIVIIIAIILALIFFTGNSGIFASLKDFLFNQSWSGTFWTNVLFIVLIALALWAVLKKAGGGGD